MFILHTVTHQRGREEPYVSRQAPQINEKLKIINLNLSFLSECFVKIIGKPFGTECANSGPTCLFRIPDITCFDVIMSSGQIFFLPRLLSSFSSCDLSSCQVVFLSQYLLVRMSSCQMIFLYNCLPSQATGRGGRLCELELRLTPLSFQ